MSLDQPTGFVKPLSVTSDAFLGGRITVTQPSKGYRAGLDAVLLGAAVRDRPGGRLLDIGSGVGTAALVALAHQTELSAVLAEIDPDLVAIAEANIAANGMGARAEAAVHDVALHAQGARPLAGGSFDIVIANPPFFERGRGTPAGDDRRDGGRHMNIGALSLWVAAASASTARRGEVIFIHRIEALAELLGAMGAHLGRLTVLPIAPRPGQPAKRVLVRATKGSRAPLVMLSPLTLHGLTGNAFATRADAIFRGEARLDW